MTIFFICFENKKDDDCAQKTSTFLINQTQKQAFSLELNQLLSLSEGKTSDLMVRLRLFLEETSIIRSGGRIDKTLYDIYEVKNPILLGKKHLLTRVIILDCHSRCEHLGAFSTLNEIRLTGYWIPQGRQAVKTTLNQCVNWWCILSPA